MGNSLSPTHICRCCFIHGQYIYACVHCACRISEENVISQELPYSSNVIKSFLVYLYTNAPPVCSTDQKSKYSPLLGDDELVQLSQLANQFGLTQLVQYCSPPQPQDTPSTTSQPSSVFDMLERFGLDMDVACFYLWNESEEVFAALDSDEASNRKKVQLFIMLFQVYSIVQSHAVSRNQHQYVQWKSIC